MTPRREAQNLDPFADPAGFLAAAALGAHLPQGAEAALTAASLVYADERQAEKHLAAAQRIAPDHAAVLIGLYRFYFYRGRLADALRIARRCLEVAAAGNGLPDDWRSVSPNDAKFGDFGEAAPRFFMFTLKGYAYLQMRVGQLEEARDAIDKLIELDPADKIGAKVLHGVLERAGQDDDE